MVKALSVMCLVLVPPIMAGCGDSDDVISPDENVVIVPARVTDLGIASRTDSSITLVWTAPEAATQYNIRYSTEVIIDAFFDSATTAAMPAAGPPGSAEGFTITGLSINTTYYFALKASDAQGHTSELSNVVSATTLTAAPPEFILGWGSTGQGNGQFDQPYGIAVDQIGNVYVTSSLRDCVQKFDASGGFITLWNSSFPVGIAVDGVGDVYVAEAMDDRIQKFNSAGGPVTSWGSSGTGNGEFDYPWGIAVDQDGNVYVAERLNHRVQKFDASGTYLDQWGSPGTGPGQFNLPAHIAVDGSGNVYVADAGNHRIQKFSGSGLFLAQLGTAGVGDGQFDQPEGIAVDVTGRIYVGDSENHRVQMFSEGGRFLTKWGSQGRADGQFERPAQIALQANGAIFVVDRSLNRVQKFQ